MEKHNIGTVIQVIGPVLDIKFPDGQLPELLNAITVQNGEETVTLEVAQHVGDNVARYAGFSATSSGEYIPGSTTVTPGLAAAKRMASLASSIAPPARDFMLIKPTFCLFACSISSAAWVSTTL